MPEGVQFAVNVQNVEDDEGNRSSLEEGKGDDARAGRARFNRATAEGGWPVTGARSQKWNSSRDRARRSKERDDCFTLPGGSIPFLSKCLGKSARETKKRAIRLEWGLKRDRGRREAGMIALKNKREYWKTCPRSQPGYLFGEKSSSSSLKFQRQTGGREGVV